MQAMNGDNPVAVEVQPFETMDVRGKGEDCVDQLEVDDFPGTHTGQAYMKALAGLGSGLDGKSLRLGIVGPKTIGRGIQTINQWADPSTHCLLSCCVRNTAINSQITTSLFTSNSTSRQPKTEQA